ncbi:acetoin dehydrogenase dihydrolipoyllysine-residue acetyltransferase subunit [Chelatococcus sp. GCM10030263]|uniref:acetoin dehydrogenase dihydrolipoyllysine-residue acetyltransferase subunit n=1 Tax=Chelatococcus sp. GCM10030263 TaxID=3273387 RepID=UPI003616070D
MPTEVILPRVDMDMATGKVSRWFVDENAKVEKGQVIFEIETDKAAMEIEAPVSGIIRDIADDQGKELPVGSVVAKIYGEDEASDAPAGPKPVAAAPGAPLDIPTAADAPAEPAPLPPAAASTTLAGVAAVESAGEAEPNGVRATPLARRLAREHRIDLAVIKGSGPRGRVQESDVLAHVASTAPAIEARPRPQAQKAASGQTAGPLHRVWLRQGGGTPLVLVHGFGADINGWRPFVHSLPADRPILGIDLPGHGRSPLSGGISIDDFAAALLDTIEAEGLDSVHLIAHSLGAAVAATAAAQARLDVRSLMLISPAGLGPDMNGPFVAGFLRATGEASLAPWVRELVFDAQALGPAFALGTLRARTDEQIKAQTEIAAHLFPDGTQGFSIRRLLGQFEWPVKVVYGAEDRIIPARHAQGLPGTIAVHIFAATGHLPHIEQRQAVGRLAAELVRAD